METVRLAFLKTSFERKVLKNFPSNTFRDHRLATKYFFENKYSLNDFLC